MADGVGTAYQMVRGPFAWNNWIAYERGEPARITWEFTLYTDAGIDDSLKGLGPYAFINTVPATARFLESREAEPALVLRAHEHIPPQDGRPGTATWLPDGDADKELAGLLSLALGIRCRSGGATRQSTGSDPAGLPIEWDHHRPYLPQPRRRGAILPSVREKRSVTGARSALETLPNLPATDAGALVLAAANYADAIWVVESEPDLAWLRLITAVEVAALRWSGGAGTPVARLTVAKPDLVRELETAGGADLVDVAAGQLADLVKSTARFVEFVLAHLPDPPGARPPAAYQLDWTDLGRRLRQVYDYRSKALHGGQPFPWPMCMVSLKEEVWAAASETMPFAGMGRGWEHWTPDDIPMMFGVFEYIARGSIINWWSTLGEAIPPRNAQPASS